MTSAQDDVSQEEIPSGEEEIPFLEDVAVDEALCRVGGYRRWHLLAFALLSFTGFGLIATQSLAIVFIGEHCTLVRES